VLLWNTETWALTFFGADSGSAAGVSVAFSPDGRLVACGYEDFMIRDAETRSLLWSQPASRRGTTWIGFSPDGSLFAGVLFASGTVTLWNANELVTE